MATTHGADSSSQTGGQHWLGRLWSATAAAGAQHAGKVLLGLLLFATGVVLMHMSGLIDIPALSTSGKIYVDSPEVYTRERLVNDRYDQDYWLRQQLKMLDDREHLQLTHGQERTSIQAGVGAGDAANQADGGARPDPPGRLSFEQEFRIVAGLRDTIRPQVLENMLDDRHDLTGNSVYGLKFDTTIIPGASTRRRAFVHVQVQVNDLFKLPGIDSSALPPHIAGYIAAEPGARPETADKDAVQEHVRRYREQQTHYQNWIKDIEKRLNRTEDSVLESMGPCPDAHGQSFYDELTRRTLEVVLGVPQEVFSRLNPPKSEDPYDSPTPEQPSPIGLRKPWTRFFGINRTPFAYPGRSPGPPCRYRVWFDLDELSEQFIPIETDGPEQVQRPPEDTAAAPNAAVESHTPQAGVPTPSTNGDASLVGEDREGAGVPITIAKSPDGRWQIAVDEAEFVRRAALFGDNEYEPRYWPTPVAVEKLLKLRKDRCDQGTAGAELCAGTGRRTLSLPSGLFNFIEDLSALDAYSYAMFPKNDVIGIWAQTSAQLSAETAGTGFLGLARSTSEGTTTSVLVGYGDGGGGGPHTRQRAPVNAGSIAFGWVISARGDMEPIQKSQLALVSVPAWMDKLHLNVSVGWLDRRGDLVLDLDEAFEVDISVPPDYETFDSLFRKDAWINRDPRIQDDEMDKDIYVEAGKETTILIPGSRLWRSAAVTLGAQLADRIRVLPNMEGIIAEFGKVALPYAAYNSDTVTDADGDGDDRPTLGLVPGMCERFGDLVGRPVRLRVWTSEGVAKAHGHVCVMYDPKKTGGDARPSSSREETVAESQGLEAPPDPQHRRER